jgi:hypothetical protein
MPKRQGSWLRRALIAAATIILLVAAFILRTLYSAGAFTHVEPHFSGTCRRIPGPVGAEDIHLEKKGSTIGPLDLLIAAHARSRGASLVTANMREFRRVPGLKCIGWKRASPVKPL